MDGRSLARAALRREAAAFLRLPVRNTRRSRPRSGRVRTLGIAPVFEHDHQRVALGGGAQERGVRVEQSELRDSSVTGGSWPRRLGSSGKSRTSSPPAPCNTSASARTSLVRPTRARPAPTARRRGAPIDSWARPRAPARRIRAYVSSSCAVRVLPMPGAEQHHDAPATRERLVGCGAEGAPARPRDRPRPPAPAGGPLVEQLRAHRRRQLEERLAAGSSWEVSAGRSGVRHRAGRPAEQRRGHDPLPRQLLQHTSGLSDHLNLPAAQQDAEREWSPSELVDLAVAEGPVAEPGTGYVSPRSRPLPVRRVPGDAAERVAARGNVRLRPSHGVRAQDDVRRLHQGDERARHGDPRGRATRGRTRGATQEWRESQPRLLEGHERQLQGAAPKAWRWVGEMEEIAATFETVGLPGGFHAAANVFRRLEQYRDAEPPPPVDEIISALLSD